MSLESQSLRKLSLSTLMNHHVIQNLTAWHPSISIPSQPLPSTCHQLKLTPLLLTAVLLPSPTINFSLSHSLTPIQNINMAPKYGFGFGFLLCLFWLLASLVEPAMGSARKLSALVEEQPLPMKYHNGALLKGKVTVNLVWYGSFSAIQRSIIIDFLESFNSRTPPSPSVASWWKTTDKYHGGSSTVVVGQQVLDQTYSLGKVLKTSHLTALASKPNFVGSVTVILTAKDVAVDGFCMSRCGTHGWTRSGKTRSAYVWVGNSETQCPGQCAWPFHQPIYGPQTPPLVAPNGDVGVDGMVINLATLLANTVTNPFNGGYFQGPPTAPLEAVSACTGVFGSGAYPGYPGRVLVDKSSGASYNAYGVNGRRYLVPAMWDPQTSACATLV